MWAGFSGGRAEKNLNKLRKKRARQETNLFLELQEAQRAKLNFGFQTNLIADVGRQILECLDARGDTSLGSERPSITIHLTENQIKKVE